MKRVTTLILTLLTASLAVFQANAQATCVADFNIISTSGLTVSFNNESSYNSPLGVLPPVSWDFGDGTTSNDYDVTHTFPAAGSYDVCVTAFELNGTDVCGTYCETIVVGNINGSCSDYLVAVTSAGSQIVMTITGNAPNLPIPDGVTWTLDGTGGTIGTGQTLTWTAPDPGVYEFCASFGVNGITCPAVCETYTVVGASCDMTIDPDISGMTGIFSAQTANGAFFTSADWTISGTGVSFTGSGNPFTYVFPSAGTWQVCATGDLVDPVTGNTCTDDGCITITVQGNNSPCDDYVAVATSTGTTVVMTLSPIDNNLPAPDMVVWSVDNFGVIGSGQTLTWDAPAGGTYTLCADYSVNGISCPSSCTDVTAIGDPNCFIDFQSDPTPAGGWIFEVIDANFGTYANILWTFVDAQGNALSATGSPLNFNFPNSGTYNVCVLADLIDPNGNTICLVSACQDITVTGSNTCPSYTVLLSDTGSGAVVMQLVSDDPNIPVPAQIDWQIGGTGVTIGTGNPYTFQTNGPGLYEFCAYYGVSDPNCPDNTCASIILAGNDDCDMTVSYTLNGLNGLFDASNAGANTFTTVDWIITGGGVSWTETGNFLDFSFPSSGTYNVCANGELVDAAGNFICSDQECVTVTVSDNTNCPIEFEFDPVDNNLLTVFEVIPHPVNNYMYDGISWEIVNPDGSVTTGLGSPFTHVFPGDGLYIVCVEANLIDVSGQLVCQAQSCLSVLVEDPNAPCEAFFEGEEFINSPFPVQNQAIFQNLSSGSYTDVLWDFGDNTISDSNAPELTHIYSNPGVYNVCLTVSDSNDPNCNDTYCDLVFITGTTPCNFEVIPTSSGQVVTAAIVSPDGTIPTVADWYLPAAGGNINIGSGATISYTFSTPGVYDLCVDYAIPGTTCAGTICIEITANNNDCAIEECVFPGDANYDEVADNFDILNIGVGFGTMGPVRPNATNQWYGQAAPAWNESFDDGVNYKHADCDGDGEIGFGDVDPIMLNYDRTHNGVVPTNFGPEPAIWLEFDLDTVYLNSNSANITINADVMVGTMALPAQDIYGLAFTVNYPAELVEEGSVQAAYVDNSFLGAADNTLQLEMVVPSQNVIDFGYSRTDQQNVSGFGTIATTSYVIIDNLIGFTSQAEYDFTLTITDVKVITNTGEEIAFAAQSATAIIIVDEETTTSIDNPIADEFLVYPNPTSNLLNIEFDRANNEMISVYNSLGQQVMVSQLSGRTSTLDFSDFASGIYLLSIHTSEGVVTKRIVVD
ncbi:MAG: PKD domain-containing protein [Bacteroidota bacterium]